MHEFDPYEMLIDIAKGLDQQSGLLLNMSKHHTDLDKNMLVLYKEYSKILVRLEKLEQTVNDLKQASADNSPR